MMIQRYRKARQPAIVRTLIAACYVSIASILAQTLTQTRLLPDTRVSNSRYGSDIAITATHAVVGAYYTNQYSGAAYLFSFTGTSWTQSTDIKASVAGLFGEAVGLSSRYAIVGAQSVSSSTGRAFIYTISGLTWTDVGLTLQGAISNEQFGSSVAITNNYAVVGAQQVNWKGKAYIYSRGSDDVWALMGDITPSDLSSNSYYGAFSALTDTHAAVSAQETKTNNIAYGAVYVFSPDSTNWVQKKKLVGYVDGSYFGTTVGLSSDFLATSVGSGSNSYIFSRSGDDWILMKTVTTTAGQVAITNSFAVLNKEFYELRNGDWIKTMNFEIGAVNSVAIFEDFVVLGNQGADSDQGEVLFYQLIQSPTQSQSQSQSWSTSPEPVEADILAYNSTRSGNFGAAVATVNNTMIASSPACTDQSRCDGGRTAVIKKDSNGDPVVVQMLQGRHRNIDAMFGYSLAVSNYWLAITSKGTSYHSAQTALVSIFGKNPDTDTIERVAGLRPKSNNQPNMDFGHSIAVGQFDIIVGVPGYDLQITIDIGAVMSFRFRISNNRWGRNPVVATAFDATAGDRFGHSVSFDEAFLAVGNNPSDNTRHAVYILTKSGFEFAHFYKISGNGKRGFGWSVLLSEDELIVSSPQDDDNGASTNGGCVTVFAKNSTNHFVEYDTIRHTPIAERRFGFAVARKGNRMAIGTNTCPNGAPCALRGKAYLYTKSSQQWVPLRSFSSGHVDGSDSFGTRVTINEEDVVVGAPNSNNGSGRVYAYYVPEISG
eukprot:TRINITY_DN4312_c0_g1_i13.p1 TRINITY_DN4312_c0_g1~~TRINITY_DN4312_c0_g1_i13.p1  ORF type:complete len:769 (+),score=120.30 TRINITY_DN4312_c0_g1_i13:193-2499(+)